MKLQLNSISNFKILDDFLSQNNDGYNNPENIDKLINQKADYRKDSRWEKGWEKAGGESYLRKLYFQNKETPDFVQKSGNPRKTIERGGLLSFAEANVVPTLVAVSEEALNSDGKIRGNEYCIFQKYVSGPDLNQRHLDSSSFKDQYKSGNTCEKAIEQFGENSAHIDKLGFGLKNSNRMIGEMLTNGDNCYIADFGADLGPPRYEPHDNMYEAGLEFLDESHHDTFKNSYSDVEDHLRNLKIDNFSPKKLSA